MKKKGCGHILLLCILYFFVFLTIRALFEIAVENYKQPEYWFMLIIVLAPTAYSICGITANAYVSKTKARVVFSNEEMNHSVLAKDYFECQDELYKRLGFISKFQFLLNKENQFNEKPSELMRQLKENEELRINSMLDRSYRFYKGIIKKYGPNEQWELYESELQKYESRMTSDNKKPGSVNVIMLKRYEQVVGTIDEVDTMEGSEFEEWCADLLTKHGFNSVKVTGKSGDQGVDITAEKGGVRYAIQCKRYSSDLDNTPVQEVYAGRMVYRCQVGVVMTNQHFTAGAKDLAENTGVLLWDRDKLIEMLETAQ